MGEGLVGAFGFFGSIALVAAVIKLAPALWACLLAMGVAPGSWKYLRAQSNTGAPSGENANAHNGSNKNGIV